MKMRTAASITAMMMFACAGTAYAQDATSTDDQAKPAKAGSDEDKGDIVVVAQRRAERLVDVPISISTASPADLERAGPESLENLTKVTPGVFLQRSSYGLSPTVRGIGSTLSTSSGEQNVALYVDEIYYPTPTGNIFDLASVADIEILKGPQGTLFGRNATGGAILIRTLDPGFKPAGRFSVSYDHLDELRASGYVNLPVTDKIAINGSVAYRYSDGYDQDLRTGRATNKGRSFTARGKILIEPTDTLTIVGTISHADLDDPSGINFRNLQPAPLLTLLSGGPISKDRYYSSFATNQVLKTTADEYSARVKLDLGAGTLSSFTAWLRNDLVTVSDLTGSYLPYSLSLETYTNTFTQEVNFASKAGQPLSYIVGVYYFKNKGGLPYAIQNGAPLFFNIYDDWSLSGYADGTYSFGKLSLIAGIRYTYEKDSADGGFGATQDTGTFTRFQRRKDSQWTPRFGLRYSFSRQSNVYATYSKGFKSGRFDRSSPTGPGVDPERVDAFELGFKYASPVATFNTAAYYYNYDNTQVNATITTPGGAVVTQLFNAPKSRIYGLEADGSLKLGDNFDVRAAVAYTHARYVDFKSAPGYVVDPTDPATLGGLLYSNVSLDVSGKTMVRSPELTASGAITYHTPIGGNNEFALTVSPYYSSRVYFSFDNSISQKPYMTLDASASLTLDEHFKISVFGRNLTDRIYKLGGGQSSLSFETATFAKPRTYGVSLGFSF